MLRENKKLVQIIAIVLVLFVVVPITTTLLLKYGQSSNTIIIDNKSSYDKDIDSDVFTNIANSAYSATSHSIKNAEKTYHGTIRKDTFKNIANDNVSFILDIPSVKISWSVSQALDNTGSPLSDASIKCVTKEQAIYTLLGNCVDQSSGGKTSEQIEFLKIVQILPLSGPSYNVTYSISTNSSYLVVTYYTDTGKQDALDAIKSLGYNPDNYAINYINGM